MAGNSIENVTVARMSSEDFSGAFTASQNADGAAGEQQVPQPPTPHAHRGSRCSRAGPASAALALHA